MLFYLLLKIQLNLCLNLNSSFLAFTFYFIYLFIIILLFFFCFFKFLMNFLNRDLNLFAFLSLPDSWLPNSDSVSLLIQLCDCLCIYLLFVVCFFEYNLQLVAWFSVFPRYRRLYLMYNQLSVLPPDIFAGLSSLQWVCVFHVAEYWDTVLECECWFSIITWHVFAY